MGDASMVARGLARCTMCQGLPRDGVYGADGVEYQRGMAAHPFEAVRISERVYWVGALDWALRDFHGYRTARGTTYNAYLIMGRSPVLLDTVKAELADEMLSRIASVCDVSRIETVISHHAEMDHTGALPALLRRCRPKRIITSAAGVAALQAHFELDVPVEGVRDGTALDVDGAALTFYDTKMVHWPESMFSYLAGDEVLFSQDAFGMHLASFERFTDELPADVVAYETGKYFANVLMPFPNFIDKLVARMGDIMKGVRVVASDHGPIWRQGFTELLASYRTWAARKPTPKVVIAYDTMWQSTAAMARVIAEAVHAAGVPARLCYLGEAHRSDVAAELLDAAALLVGSPNLNGQMYPTVADLLSYVRGLKPQHLMGAAFGSYGWSSSASVQVEAGLKECGIEVVEPALITKFVPKQGELERCRALGTRIAEHVRTRCPAG